MGNTSWREACNRKRQIDARLLGIENRARHCAGYCSVVVLIPRPPSAIHTTSYDLRHGHNRFSRTIHSCTTCIVPDRRSLQLSDFLAQDVLLRAPSIGHHYRLPSLRQIIGRHQHARRADSPVLWRTKGCNELVVGRIGIEARRRTARLCEHTGNRRFVQIAVAGCRAIQRAIPRLRRLRRRRAVSLRQATTQRIAKRIRSVAKSYLYRPLRLIGRGFAARRTIQNEGFYVEGLDVRFGSREHRERISIRSPAGPLLEFEKGRVVIKDLNA